MSDARSPDRPMKDRRSNPKPAATSAPRSSEEPVLAVAVGLCVITLLIFAPAHRFDFINYDDGMFVFENARVRAGLTWEGVRWAFTSADIDYWRPLSWLSHMVDVELHGLKGGGHHLTSVLIHVANAALLLFALRRLTGKLWPSAFVAALFAWHPLHVESVAWIAERKDVLCAFFWFLTLWCYAGYVRAPSARTYALTLGFFTLGLMSKPMIITLPFQLLLLDIWPLRRWRLPGGEPVPLRAGELSPVGLGRLLLEKAPFFALTVAACLATYVAQKEVGAMMPEHVHSAGARLTNIPTAYAAYLGKTFWPTNLAVFYPMPRAWPAAQVALSIGLVLGFSGLAVWWWRRRPWFATGWFWFLGTLVPVIGLIQVGDQAMADRYTYVPLVGLFVALVWLADEWRQRQGLIVPVAGAVALGACLLLTSRQLQHWRDGLSIFEQALRATRDNFVAMTNLANNLGKLGRTDRAIALYEQALRVRPDSVESLYNLGVTLAEIGQKGPAEKNYREALRYHPAHAKAHNNLANLLSDQGKTAESLTHYAESLRLKPDNMAARFNYGLALMDSTRSSEAIAQFREAVRLKPDLPAAHRHLAALLTEAGQKAEALSHILESIRWQPDSAESHFNAGSLLLEQGQSFEAISHLATAVRLRNDLTPALQKLAWIRATHPAAALRNPPEALALAQRLDSLTQSTQPLALDTLAAAQAANGQFAAAAATAQQAAALAVAAAQAQLAADIERRRELYLAGRPYVSP